MICLCVIFSFHLQGDKRRHIKGEPALLCDWLVELSRYMYTIVISVFNCKKVL